MNMTVDHAQGPAPVTILGLDGDLDASNFKEVIVKAQELYSAGTEYLLIDMSDVPFMSSAGLVALHSVALIMRGEEPPGPDAGWAAFHAIDRDRDSGLQPQVKIVNPQPMIDETLEVTGLKEFFEIHPDLETAMASF
jgi:anti-anti-sigma regulatory factor